MILQLDELWPHVSDCMNVSIPLTIPTYVLAFTVALLVSMANRYCYYSVVKALFRSKF